MRYNYHGIKKYDFIELETKFEKKMSKYIVISVLKDLIKVIPIIEENEKSAACPIVAIPNVIISQINKIDDYKLLFYSDLNNSYIEKAIISKNNNRKTNAKI